MKNIVSVGFKIPSNQEDYLRIDSFNSLSDADIVVFSPNLSGTSYSTYTDESWNSKHGSYEGKKLYNKRSSANILDHHKHWRHELSSFVKSGRTLFVVLPEKESFFVHAGTNSVSGTGRNQKILNHVSAFTNYDFLPFSKLEFKPATGKSIVPKDPAMAEFYKHFKDYMSFSVYIRGEGLHPTFTTRNSDLLGINYQLQSGNVVFIPNVDFVVDELTVYNNRTNKGEWNKEAFRLGKIFCNLLVEIDRSLKNKELKTPKPEWISNEEYAIKASEEVKKLISKNLKEIEKRNQENIQLDSVLEEHESLKDLLFETGKPLELAVIKALTILGFHAENYDDGKLELDQIITSPEGLRYIGECEGKDSKDIDISKFRQLLDSLNEDFEREEVTEKAMGLLFGNPQRLLHPNERTLDFTQKCISGAKRERIGLIKTADLYEVARYLSENEGEEYKVLCRNAIYEQLGDIVLFPALPS